MSDTLIGHVKGCHNPRNEDCPQNTDAKFNCDCKSTAPPKERKPYREVRVHDRNVGHGVRDHFVAEIWPDGKLVIREQGRRLRVETTLGVVYQDCLNRAARRIINEKRAAKAAKKSASRKARKLARKARR